MKVTLNNFQRKIRKYKKEYLHAFSTTLDSGWFILGPEVKKFEQEFSTFLKAKYCVGVANGLEAIQIALLSLGISKGDEVITTPLSAVATTLAIISVGATPVFVDTDKNGLIAVSKIEKALSRKTKALLPVHLYGNCPDMGKLLKIAKKHKLFLIEDAAQAHGAKYKDRMLGTIGDIGCFSFYPTKNLGAFGDCGALVTKDKKTLERSAAIRDYGQESKYRHTVYGLNSRLDEIHAALLSVNLKLLKYENITRTKLARRYIKNLEKITQIRLVSPESFCTPNYHLLVIRVPAAKREKLREHLASSSIDAHIHYPLTIPDQPLFGNKYKKLSIPEARQFVKEIITLPCNPYTKPKEVDYVCSRIKDFFQSNP